MPKAIRIDFAKGKVLSVVDAATEVGVHFTTLYRWIQAGEVSFVTFGDNIFVPLLEVERLKKERKERKEPRGKGAIEKPREAKERAAKIT